MPGVVLVAGPLLVAMQDDEVAFRDRALEVNALAGILPRHPLEVRDEGGLAVGDVRVVLDIVVARIAADGLRRLALVEHQVVERDDGLPCCARAGLPCGVLRSS